MAIDTTVQPFIQKMLQPPDPKVLAQAIEDAVSGFAGAYQSRKEIDREEANKPPDQRKSGFERFTEAYTRAPGKVAEGAAPFGALERRERTARVGMYERQNAIEDQVSRVLKDPIGLMNEVGKLSPDQLPDWLKRNAGITASPIGKRIWDAVNETYKQTATAQIQAGRAKHLGDLAAKYPNIDLSDPKGLAQAQRNQSVHELYDRARVEGKLLNELPDDWFNSDGTINEQKAVPGIGSLPRSEALQSREEIASARLQAQLDMLNFKIEHGGGYTPGAMQKDIEFIRKLNLPAEQIDKAIKTRIGLEPKAGVEHIRSEQEYVDKHLERYITEHGIPLARRAEAIETLRQEYRRIYGGVSGGAVKRYNPATGKLE